MSVGLSISTRSSRILELIAVWLQEQTGIDGDAAADLCEEIGLTPVVDAVMWERALQQEKGLDADHDDQHTEGELAKAAICYAQAALQQEARAGLKVPFFFMPHAWPFNLAEFHPSEDPVENLVKSAAMMIAEAERILRKRGRERKAGNDTGGTPVVHAKEGEL